MGRIHLKAIACLSLIGVLFYWKFLLTHQYSLLTGFEGANQAYSWYGYIARSIKEGSWPIWDPYTFSGRSFVGEMQTAAFYPINFLLAAIPFNDRGLLSPGFYHWLYLAAHVLGAYFTFALVRTFGLSVFASLLSGLCFSFGGFMARLGGWPHMFQSGIWLPLICLFTVKALNEVDSRRRLAYSVLGGLGLGLSILAGGLHLAMMQAAVVTTMSIAFIFLAGKGRGRELWKLSILVFAVVLIIGAISGAVQILPSIEYSQLSFRSITGGSVGASDRIDYQQLNHGLFANALSGLVFGAPAGQVAAGEYISPYLGVLPLLLAALAIWKRWDSLWVRYCTALFGAAFLYSLGSFSLLHGLSYALVPFLWMAREPGRFMYLADFGLAILAGFGAEQVFAACTDASAWRSARKLMAWLGAASMLALVLPAIYGKPEVNPWGSFSLLLITMSCGLLLYVLHGHRGLWPRLLVTFLTLFDLYAFDWSASNRAQEASKGTDHLARLLSFEDAARFLKAKSGSGLFRVQMSADLPPNIGDAFGIQSTWGAGVTVPVNYDQMRENIDLLNVRYIVRPASASEPGAVYEDRSWKIYKNPAACPRAWLVHETVVEQSPEKLRQRVGAADFDPRRLAVLPHPLTVGLDPLVDGAAERVDIERYEPRAIQLRVQAHGRGLLVLSELFYPGWRAEVNGKDVGIVEVDRALRGIPVSAGESRVVVRYAPRSVAAGAALTVASFCALPFALMCLRRSRPFRQVRVTTETTF